MANSANVRIGYAGMVLRADVGTAAPADIGAAWPTGWTDLGLISTDGLTEGKDQTVTTIPAWGYDGPVRSQTSNRITTFRARFLETNAHTLSLYHQIPIADMTSGGTGPTQSLNFTEGQSQDPLETALGIHIIDGTRIFRFIVPRAQLTDRSEVTYKSDEAVSYECTVTTLLASDGTSLTRMYGGVVLPS
jgi:hypothetical protein